MLRRQTLSFITASLVALLATTAHSFSVLRMATTTARSPLVPRIIQGGMGIRISSWELARAVSQKGELGVISGTGVDTIMVRTLQNGTTCCIIVFRRTACTPQLTIFYFSSITTITNKHRRSHWRYAPSFC